MGKKKHKTKQGSTLYSRPCSGLGQALIPQHYPAAVITSSLNDRRFQFKHIGRR